MSRNQVITIHWFLRFISISALNNRQSGLWKNNNDKQQYFIFLVVQKYFYKPIMIVNIYYQLCKLLYCIILFNTHAITERWEWLLFPPYNKRHSLIDIILLLNHKATDQDSNSSLSVVKAHHPYNLAEKKFSDLPPFYR